MRDLLGKEPYEDESQCLPGRRKKLESPDRIQEYRLRCSQIKDISGLKRKPEGEDKYALVCDSLSRGGMGLRWGQWSSRDSSATFSGSDTGEATMLMRAVSISSLEKPKPWIVRGEAVLSSWEGSTAADVRLRSVSCQVL